MLDRTLVRLGKWTLDEENKLREGVETNGGKDWVTVAYRTYRVAVALHSRSPLTVNCPVCSKWDTVETNKRHIEEHIHLKAKQRSSKDANRQCPQAQDVRDMR
jgi:hypothetical protein